MGTMLMIVQRLPGEGSKMKIKRVGVLVSLALVPVLGACGNGAAPGVGAASDVSASATHDDDPEHAEPPHLNCPDVAEPDGAAAGIADLELAEGEYFATPEEAIDNAPAGTVPKEAGEKLAALPFENDSDVRYFASSDDKYVYGVVIVTRQQSDTWAVSSAGFCVIQQGEGAR